MNYKRLECDTRYVEPNSLGLYVRFVRQDLVSILRSICLLSGIMEDVVQYFYGISLEQVNFLIADDRKVSQELEHLVSRKFLENDFASESPGAGTYQFLTELAAKENVSVDEVQRRLPVLFSKIRKFRESQAVVEEMEGKTDLSVSNLRKLKKALKRRFIPLAECNDIIADLVENFWNYLSTDLHETLRHMKVSLLEIDAKTPILRAEETLRYYGKLPDITKKRYRFYKSVSRLRLALLRVKDFEVDNEVWIEEDAHQAEKLSEFFDRAIESALNDPTRYWEVYTEEMAAEDDELTKDVLIDD